MHKQHLEIYIKKQIQFYKRKHYIKIKKFHYLHLQLKHLKMKYINLYNIKKLMPRTLGIIR